MLNNGDLNTDHNNHDYDLCHNQADLIRLGMVNWFQIVRSILFLQAFLLLVLACFLDSCTFQNNKVKRVYLCCWKPPVRVMVQRKKHFKVWLHFMKKDNSASCNVCKIMISRWKRQQYTETSLHAWTYIPGMLCIWHSTHKCHCFPTEQDLHYWG